MSHIHVRAGSARKKLAFGDLKVIKGVEHIRCYKTVNMGTPRNPGYAYDCTGGRHRVDWVPVDQANLLSLTRKRDYR